MPTLPDVRVVNCHRQVHVVAYRCYALRTRIEELEIRLTPTQLTTGSFALLVLLVLILLVAAYSVDVTLIRALAEFVAGLASSGLEEIARWLVPGIILALEVFVATSRARDRDDTFVAADAFAVYDPKPQHNDTIWRVLGGLLLLIQPLGAGATYLALEQADPGFSTQNQLLFAFLLVIGLVAHLAVLLFSGRYLTALAGAIEQRAIAANLRKAKAAYLTACQELLRRYQDYRILRTQNPSTQLDLDPLAAAEIQHALSLGQPSMGPTAQTAPPASPSMAPHGPAPAPPPGEAPPAATSNVPPLGLPDPPNPYAPANDQWGDDQRL